MRLDERLVRFAARLPPRTWILGGLITVGALAIGTPVVVGGGYIIEQFRGVVTEEVVADGSTQAVHWKEYPGVVDIDTAETLSGPSFEDGLRDGDAMITEIQAGLTAQLGVQWGKRPDAPVLYSPRRTSSAAIRCW